MVRGSLQVFVEGGSGDTKRLSNTGFRFTICDTFLHCFNLIGIEFGLTPLVLAIRFGNCNSSRWRSLINSRSNSLMAASMVSIILLMGFDFGVVTKR